MIKVRVLENRNQYGLIIGQVRQFPVAFANELISLGLVEKFIEAKASKAKVKPKGKTKANKK